MIPSVVRFGPRISVMVFALAFVPFAAKAAEPDSHFNELRNKYTNEKKLVIELGDRVLSAMRPMSSGSGEVVKHEVIQNTTKKTVTYKFKMKFTGAKTGTSYTADVSVVCDASNEKAWEVLLIEYEDDVALGYNKESKADLLKKLNSNK